MDKYILPSTVTLNSSVEKKNNERPPLLDLYKWFYDIYKCVAQAILEKDHSSNDRCAEIINTLKDELVNGKDAPTIKFDKPANNQEKIMQTIYVQKMDIREKLFSLLAEEIASSWKALKQIAATINTKSNEINAKAEATRSYFHAYLDKTVKPLVQGRKLIAEDQTSRTMTNKEYTNQKLRCDAALRVLQDLQTKHREFWQTAGTQADLVALREIQALEKAAMKKTQEEVDRMTAVRRKMLETDLTTTSGPSFSLQEPAEEAEQYLRDFQRIVEEECNCYKYRIMEYKAELNKVAKQEIQRIKTIVSDVQKEEEKLLKACDTDIGLIQKDATQNNVLHKTHERMKRERELVMRRKLFYTMAKAAENVCKRSK